MIAPMSRPSSDGLRPPSPAERQRLGYDHFGTLAALLNERTFDHILAFGISDGWRCWEAGAGGDSVPRWLAEQVGPSGYVLASDIDTSMLEATPDPPYQVRRHDLTVDPPPTAVGVPPACGGFDLVHARLVLEHLTNPAAALTTLVSALRPGGWLLVERRTSISRFSRSFPLGAASGSNETR